MEEQLPPFPKIFSFKWYRTKLLNLNAFTLFCLSIKHRVKINVKS
jgi:hypothetical protein